jgi:macrolide-specific efflux system membrane fusion protein
MMSKLFSSALAALLLVSCTEEPQTPATPDHVDAATAIVQASTLTSMRSVAGTVRSANVSPLAAKVMGNIVRVHVAEGDRVRAGQLLVEIDSRSPMQRTNDTQRSARAIR